MTVFTKADGSEEKKEKVAEAVVVAAPVTAPAEETPAPATEVDVESQNEANSSRRRCRCSSLCIGVLLVWLAFALFVGGLFFGRHIGRRGAFHGWCGTTINDDGHAERLEQKIEVDPNELYEKIQVPQFGSNRPAVFVHDFRRNLTAIVDVMGRRCFLKELDRSTAAPPRSLIELVSKMESGSFQPAPRVVHETFRIGSQLNRHELLDLGSFVINRHCLHRPVFLLHKTSNIQGEDRTFLSRDKRQAPTEELQFSVMAGETVEVDKILF